jgi:small-conductance mechanosensitive channel
MIPVRFRTVVVCLAFILLLNLVPALAQTAESTPVLTNTPTVSAGAPISLNGQMLFALRVRSGSLTPLELAGIINHRLDDLAHNPFRQRIEIVIVDAGEGTDIIADNQLLLTVTDAEAAANGKPRALLAQEWASTIRQAVNSAKTDYQWKTLLKGALYALLATLVFGVLGAALNFVYRQLGMRIQAGRNRLVRWVRIQQLPVFSHLHVQELLLGLLRVLRFAGWLVLLSFYLPLVLSCFPWSRGLAQRIVGYAVSPLAVLWGKLIEYLPNLFFIIVIGLVTWGLIKLARLVFTEIASGTLRISGFEPDWAMFTYKIAAFLLMVGGTVIAFPYMPGSESPAFRGVSLFLGVLFSLASSSAISNVIAGVILTYTGAFRLNDRVKIADVVGDVTERTLLVTRLKTIKNEEVSIPNSVVLNGQVTNYTILARETGLILHTTVTIGYDVPWRQVHQLLIQAALNSADVLVQPAPFVLQTSLNDYHISYQLNAYTDHPERMVQIYSGLHQQIQDQFNTANVEILSPAFTSLRDGNAVTISAEHLPLGYRAPGFKLEWQGRKNGTHIAAKSSGAGLDET